MCYDLHHYYVCYELHHQEFLLRIEAKVDSVTQLEGKVDKLLNLLQSKEGGEGICIGKVAVKEEGEYMVRMTTLYLCVTTVCTRQHKPPPIFYEPNIGRGAYTQFVSTLLPHCHGCERSCLH